MTELSLWQQIVGVLVAVAPVLGWAMAGRIQPRAHGRHRPERVAAPVDVLDCILAAVPDPPAPEPFDDWYADLPTTQFMPPVDLSDLYDSVPLATR